MRLVVLLLAAGLAAECTRTPAEDFATRGSGAVNRNASEAPHANAAPPASGAPLADRCIKPTPAAAPPPVAPGPARACPPDPEGHPPVVPIVRVSFVGSGASVDAELVRSPHDTERGLMYRTSMPEDRGMLFDLGSRDDHQFWMHNTCIPLDLLYVDEDGLVVGIVENAPTLDDSPRGVGCPSRYVLEVNAGWARRHGITAGRTMNVPPEAR